MIDFSQLRISPWEHALDPVASAVSEWANRRHQEKMQETALAEKRHQDERLAARDEENARRNRAKEDRENRRLVGQQTVANQRQRGDVERQVRAAVAAGDMDTAEQIANSYTEADPETGDVRRGLQGFKVNRPTGPAPQMPANPVEYGPREAEPAPLAPPPAEEGPMATPEIARNAGKIRAYQAGLDTVGPNRDTANADEAEAERRRFEAQRMAAMAGGPVPEDPRAAERARFASVNTAPADAAMAVFQNKAYQHQRALDNPTITIGGVETTPEKLRYASGRQNAQDWNRVGSVLQATRTQMLEAGDEQGAEAVQHKIQMHSELLPQIESGALTPAKAASMLGSLTTADMKAGLEREKIQAALDRVNARGGYQLDAARIGADSRVEAAATGAATRAAVKAEERGNGANEKTYARVQADLQQFDRAHNVSADRKEESRITTLLNNNGTAIIQRAITANLSRGIGAEKGVLTNQDISRLQGHLGGYWADVENWLTKGATGQLAPEVLAELTKGLEITLQEKAKDRAAAEKAYIRKFIENDAYPGQKWGYGKHLLADFEEKFGHPYQGAAAATGAGARPRPGRDFEPGGIDDPNNEDPLDNVQVKPNAITADEARARAKKARLDPEAAVQRLRQQGMISD